MQVNTLLGYLTDRLYSKDSKTSVGYFALIKVISQVKGVYFGSLAIPLSGLKLGANGISAIYFGSTKIV